MQAVHAERAGFPHSYAAMFYLNPYHISPQPLVGSVQNVLGIPAGLILYALVTALASSALISIITLFEKAVRPDPANIFPDRRSR